MHTSLMRFKNTPPQEMIEMIEMIEIRDIDDEPYIFLSSQTSPIALIRSSDWIA